MATYVQITRDEFEDWLNSLTPLGGKSWARMDGKAGVYLVHLNDLISVLVSSSVGGNDQVVAKDQGSMSLRLVSRKRPARVLNKKGVGQGKFYRTKEWRKSLIRGFKNLVEVYQGSKEFYDRLAQIENPLAYRDGWITAIKKIPGSDQDTFLRSILTMLGDGKLLSIKQEEVVMARIDQAKAPVREQASPAELVVDQDLVARMGVLNILMSSSFTQSLLRQVSEGKELSGRQLELVASMEAKLLQWVSTLGKNTQNSADLQFLRRIYRPLRSGNAITLEDARLLRSLLQVGGRTATENPMLMDIPRSA